MEKFGIIQDDQPDVFSTTADVSGAEAISGSFSSDSNDVDVFGDESSDTTTDIGLSQTTDTNNTLTSITADNEEEDFLSMISSDDNTSTGEDTDNSSSTDVDVDGAEDGVEGESTYALLAKDLIEVGVFSQDDDEEGTLPTTPEEFLARFNEESTKKANTQLREFLSRFGEDYQDAFRAIFVQGVHPKDYFNTASSADDILGMDLEVETNQEKIVRKYYSEVKGLSEAKVNRLIAGSKEDGELADEANNAMEYYREQRDTNLRQIEEQKAQEIKRKQEEHQFFSHRVQQYLSEKANAKDIDGLKFNDQVSANVQRMLTQHAWKLPSGELITDFQKFISELSNPDKIDIAIKIALLRENDFDFSKIQAKKTLDEKTKIFSNLNKAQKRANPVDSKPQTKGSFFNKY